MSSYAGIGSTKTPSNITRKMTDLAKQLDQSGFMLTSGGADGADTAFERGSTNKQIFLPEKGWNNNDSPYFLEGMNQDIVIKAKCFSKQFHPAWDRLTPFGELFMTRNVFQILGKDLTNPVDFVVCWTHNGKDAGGTGQAIRIANSRKIPVFNLKLDDDYDSLVSFLNMREHLYD